MTRGECAILTYRRYFPQLKTQMRYALLSSAADAGLCPIWQPLSHWSRAPGFCRGGDRQSRATDNTAANSVSRGPIGGGHKPGVAQSNTAHSHGGTPQPHPPLSHSLCLQPLPWRPSERYAPLLSAVASFMASCCKGSG